MARGFQHVLRMQRTGGSTTCPGELVSGKSRCACALNSFISLPSFADRDIVMQYHWGLAVGHIYSHTDHCAEPQRRSRTNSSSSSDAGELLGSNLMDAIIDSIEEYEVEEVLDSRMRQGKLEYLVHWKGYPQDEDTWELEENVQNSADLILQFHANHPSSPHSKGHVVGSDVNNIEEAEGETDQGSEHSLNSGTDGEEDEGDDSDDEAFNEMYGDARDYAVYE